MHMYDYEQPTFYDESQMMGWHPYESAPPSFPQPMPQHSIPQNQLRKKVDSVASLNDIAERDYVEMQAPPPMHMQMHPAHPHAASAMPFYHYDPHYNQPAYPQYPLRQMNNQPTYTQYPPDFATPMTTPLRQLSLNHPIHAPDPYSRPAYVPPGMEQKMHDPYYDRTPQRRVSFVDDQPLQRAAAPPLHPYADAYQENQGLINPRVLSLQQPLRAGMPASHDLSMVSGTNAQEEEEFMTISFKPQVRLVRAETVKLVLADFEGPDVHNFPVQCKPDGAFATASWISDLKQLRMVLGANVDMNVPVTIIIPSTAGIRRIGSTEPEPSSVPPSEPPVAPALPQAQAPMVIPAQQSPSAEEKKQRRAEERRAAFLAAAPVDMASPVAPEPEESYPPSDCTAPFPAEPAEVFFDEIPDLPPNERMQEQLSPSANDEGLTQAQWARKRLEQEPRAVQRSVPMNSNSVGAQSVWAKKELENRSAPEAAKNFDASAVAEQAQWAKEQLESRPQRESEAKFDAEAVASQAKWAKESLNNREQHQSESKFDAKAVGDQARWARERLELMPQNEKEEEEKEEVVKKQDLFDAFPDMEDVIDE